MRKIDGHTHTEFCPHGTGEAAEQMIKRAIKLGFDEYHITEHPPLPAQFLKKLEPNDELVGDIGLTENEVDRYLKKMLDLKEKYKSELQIKVGFEMDYLPGYEKWTRDFLNEYGKYCDTGILSVHFLPDKTGFRCMDYKAEDVKNHLLPFYGGVTPYQLAYYKSVMDSIYADLGKYKPTRIGHMTLVNKFQKDLGFYDSAEVQHLQEQILKAIAAQKYSLDVNMAGLFKAGCGQAYPPGHLVQKAKSLNIPLIYGSDAHGVSEVGRGYESYLVF